MRSSVTSRALAALLALVLIGSTAPPGRADEAKLRVVPDQIALQPGLLSQDVVVTFEPPAKATVREAHLQWFDNPGVKVSLKSQPELPTASDLAWTLTVAAGPQAAKESLLVFLLTWRLDEGGAAAAHSAVAIVTAKVAYSGVTLQQSIKVTAVNGFDTLVAGDHKSAVLLVENSGVDDISLDTVERQSPAHLTVTAAGLPQKIPGRSTVPVPITIGTTERIAPGTAPLLLDLRFSRPSDGDRATVNVSDPVQAAIPGLSEIKTALQVPTLLLLPGMLVVLTWSLLWPLAYGEEGKTRAEFALKFNTAGFWIVAVSLSLVIAKLYSHCWTHDETGMLETVSLQDVAIIWFGSIFAVSPLLYFTGAGVTWGVRAWQKNEEARRQAELAGEERARNPQTTDGPVDILVKLARLVPRATLQRPAYNVGEGAGAQLLFALGFGAAADAQHAWVSPRILIARAAGALGSKIEDICLANDLLQLVRFLEDHAGEVELAWDKTGSVKGPAQIELARLSELTGEQIMVTRP